VHVFVRVNGARSGLMADDLEAVVCSRLDGVLLPKVEALVELSELDAILAELEIQRSLPRGRIAVLPLIETALGVVRCEEIALAVPARVLTLVFGLGDFSADLGIDITRDGTELLYARSRIAVAARAADLAPALDGPYPDLRDTRGLIEDTRRSRQLGYQGRVAVYPPQVEHIQRGYSDLTPDEAERARRIVSLFESAEAAGSASIQVDGQFVDYPIFHRARQKLQRFEALGPRPKK
jgi:citrate lyase subunit beta/citryl-CoA lyase